jgi:hypothetical protein
MSVAFAQKRRDIDATSDALSPARHPTKTLPA